jgi:hypothetical protein
VRIHPNPTLKPPFLEKNFLANTTFRGAIQSFEEQKNLEAKYRYRSGLVSNVAKSRYGSGLVSNVAKSRYGSGLASNVAKSRYGSGLVSNVSFDSDLIQNASVGQPPALCVEMNWALRRMSRMDSMLVSGKRALHANSDKHLMLSCSMKIFRNWLNYDEHTINQI